MRFKNKVTIVTGAGNGIGLEIAQRFAAEGAQVVVADINLQSGDRAAADINASGGRAISLPVDVADETQVAGLVAAIKEKFGRIDILVNNAGVVLHKLLVDMELVEWNRQLAVQLSGPFLASKHVARHMIERGGYGKIVNISSVASVMGRVKAGGHCVSKAGLNLLTKVLAMELGQYHINVNAVAPGLIDVPSQRSEDNLSQVYQTNYMKEVPLGRIGKPDDIAKMVLFLASDEADWITGQVYLVDGGLMSGHLSFQGFHDFSMLDGH